MPSGKISCNSLLFVLFLFVLLCCKQVRKESSISSLSQRLDSLFNTAPDFSGVVLVAEKGKPVYHKAFGYKTFADEQPLDTASIFELASVSKQFTAMIIMILQEEGKVSYDDPIEKYIPGLPYGGITVRNLLNHTSGLPDYQAVMNDHWDKTKIAGNTDNIEYLKKYHPPANFAPGEKYEYSNTGYMLLASIAEKASGKNFIQLCREMIFVPLKMRDTDIRSLEEKAKRSDIAWGHIFVKEKQRYIRADSFPEFNYTIWLGKRVGPGRISSTTTDLLKWDQALYTNQLVKQETLEQAFASARLNNDSLSTYGFGWNISQHPVLGKVVSHTGDNPGYSTVIVRYIDVNKTVAMLCNNAHPKFDELVISVNKEIVH
jgi:CubicO group peptidase (beta-lactamase class C family)